MIGEVTSERSYVDNASIVVLAAFALIEAASILGASSSLVSVFVSTASANSFFDRHGNYDGAYVITESPDLNNALQKEIAEKYNVNIISPKTIAEMISRISTAISISVGNIAAVSLMVASVGIITTLWTSMMERIREIGILKAIGFTNSLIMRLFLNEAVIIGAVGGGLGLVFGVGLAYAMRRFFAGEFAAINPIFTPQTFVLTWLLCLILSVISGFYPAWRASQLDPVVALRHE